MNEVGLDMLSTLIWHSYNTKQYNNDTEGYCNVKLNFKSLFWNISLYNYLLNITGTTYKIIGFVYKFTGRRNFNAWDTFQSTWLVDIFRLDQKMCVGPFQYTIVSYQFSKTTVETRQSYHCFISTKWYPLWQDSNFMLLKWAPNLLKSLSLWVSRHQRGYV